MSNEIKKEKQSAEFITVKIPSGTVSYWHFTGVPNLEGMQTKDLIEVQDMNEEINKEDYEVIRDNNSQNNDQNWLSDSNFNENDIENN